MFEVHQFHDSPKSLFTVACMLRSKDSIMIGLDSINNEMSIVNCTRLKSQNWCIRNRISSVWKYCAMTNNSGKWQREAHTNRSIMEIDGTKDSVRLIQKSEIVKLTKWIFRYLEFSLIFFHFHWITSEIGKKIILILMTVFCL